MLAIGDLASRTGLAVSAIRYYEEIGLIPKATRRPSGHRVYLAASQDLLTLIRRCRDFGFTLDDTKALASLASSSERDCVEARDLAQSHLDAVRTKLSELNALERSLSAFVTACDEGCAGGPAPECCILRDLGAADARPAARPTLKPTRTRDGCCG
ncbi:MerR family DNA-binding transcriptional regulator [Caenimonas sedimenti]|uniref:MerR family DNA-binding transcriptional regulator n=2 Tax=Caenimonas sedimenti TaxID=2596921 RepID=A0A562ZIT5_9BURK|nr:MerR family DNA-binding transcriptional regulator [Caenimonas sedimenti]